MNDEHILNFKENFIENLPEWFENRTNLTLICGPGDYVHRGKTNIEQFYTYDIFCCYGDDLDTGSDESYTSVQENLIYLKNNFFHEKILCLIDLTNENQVQNFLALFNNKIMILTAQDGHSPIFDPIASFYLLIDGGVVIPKAFDKRRQYNAPYYGKYSENPYGFECINNNYIEPSTQRKFTNAFICIKKDYSNYNGGKKKKNKTRKNTKSKKKNRR